MPQMGEFKIGINNRLFDKARAEVDHVRFLSVDHICNIALAEWLNRKVKEDEKEKRRKEKNEHERAARGPFMHVNESGEIGP